MKARARSSRAKPRASRARSAAARRPAQRPTVLIRRVPASSFGYRARTIAREEGRSYQTGSGDYHLRYDLNGNRDESRAYYQDFALYSGVIDRAVDNIVRHGFALQIKTDDAKFNAKAEELRKEAWRRPEIRGNLSGLQVEQLVCRDVLVAGDMGVAFIEEGRESSQFQLIEAERITDGRGGAGVTLDKLGRVQQYRVADYTPTGRISSRFTTHTPETLSLVADPRRISQTRGTPALVSAFPYINRIEDMATSEALAMQILSRLAFSVIDPEAKANGYGNSRSDPDAQDTEDRLDFADRIHDLGKALVFNGPPGSKVEGIARNIPGPNFEGAVRMFLRIMGLPIGLPLELVLLDWSQSNYSSARAALEQAYTAFKRWQGLLVNLFYEPVLNWQLNQWMSDDRLPPYPGGAAAIKRVWIPPPFLWLDALKEAQAWGVKLDRGMVTYAEVCASLGRDIQDVRAERKAEFRDAIVTANELMSEFPGVRIDWRYFAGLLPGNGPTAPDAKAPRGSKTPEPGGDRPDGEEPGDDWPEDKGWPGGKRRGGGKE